MLLPYTLAQAEHAHEHWHFMCGHFSIAAASGKTLKQIHTCGVEIKPGGWMNPTMIGRTLDALRVSYRKPTTLQGIDTSADEGRDAILHLVGSDPDQSAILRIQWEGTWLNPGVPKGAAYQRTHYIAVKDGRIMDPAMGPYIHMPVDLWLQEVPKVVKQIKNATGYHFTHAGTLTQ